MATATALAKKRAREIEAIRERLDQIEAQQAEILKLLSDKPKSTRRTSKVKGKESD